MKRLHGRLARLQRAQKPLESEKASKRSDRKDYWKRIAKQAMRAAACGDTRKLYRMLKSFSRRPADVGEVLSNKMEALFQTKPKGYACSY